MQEGEFGDFVPSDSYLFLQALRAAKEESMKEFEAVDEGRQRLEARLAKLSLVVNPDTDDTGDCQFDAVADQLNLVGEEALSKEEVRRRTIQWLRDNGDYRLSEEEANRDTLETWVQETQGLEWDHYLDRMQVAKVWGDEVTLRGLVEAFQVKILVFSSTVSEENYFSQHTPRHGDAKRRLLLCHFLEIHYGSLLSQAQFEEREAAKRAELLRCLALCDARQQALFLEDIFLKDNFNPELSAPLITRSMVATAVAAPGCAFDTLAALLQPARVRLKPERVAQVRAKAHEQQPVKSELYDLRQRNAHLEQQLAAALSLIDTLRGAAPERNEEDTLRASYLLDEDGKYWINVEWELTESTQPRAGDMLSIHAHGGESDKPVQRLPTTASGLQGAALFEVPKKIGHYVARYSRKGKLIAESEVFLAGPHVKLSVETEGSSLEVHYEFVRGASSTYDWVGLYKNDKQDAYIVYQYVKPSKSYVQFKGVAPGSYVVKYFSGESKRTPVATAKFDL